MNDMNENNYLYQTSTHCLICHQDYIGSHQCASTTSSIPCQKCQLMQEQLLRGAGRNYKYCPYCGKEL
jgi:hypothetical protein